MKFSNPIVLLILLVGINAVIISAMCLSAKAEVLQLEERNKILLTGVFGFLASSGLAVVLGNKLIAAFIEPLELSSSRIMAVTNFDETAAGSSQADLVALTDRLVTELETSRQRERLIADYSSDILCCLDEKRRFLDLNIQSESVWDYQIMSLLATPLDLLVCSEDKDAFLQYFDACKMQEQSKALECRVKSRSGRLIDLEWQVEWSPTSQNFFCLAKNISDRKETQRLKAEITAMVGHDLRAPVSSLSFLLEGLSTGVFGDLSQDASDKIKRASDNVKQMLKLINQLLDAEKLEGGQMEVDLKIIPLSELYESCAELLSDLAGKRGIALTFPEESSTLALADFDRCQQVLSNLLSNAIKWSPEDASVVVSECIERNYVSIKVTDKGPGIAQERQQAVFERYKSLDNREDKTLASSGLGLYIAKKLTELQGGSIGLSSEPGKGSTFWFTLQQAHESDLPGYLD